ncbi:HAMP domain-containing sensor histidine kinase [Longispora sp. K20-0274]|uniref:sensor histidine kinase n=1 Tax=Longispora sp. K20-0274 TaxID=3088255 RepID=UPI00399C37B6
MRLSTRFALLAAVAVPVLVLVSSFGLLAWLRADLKLERDDRLHVRAVAAAKAPNVDGLVGAGGLIIGTRAGERTVGDVPAGGRLPNTSGPFTLTSAGEVWRGYAVIGPNDRRVYALEPNTALTNRLGQQRRRMFAVAGLSIPIAALAGFALGSAATRPLRRLQQRAAAGPGERIDLVTGVAEVDDVARALDLSLAQRDAEQARTAHALKAARSFAAAAAHELRTPLTSMRTNLELLGHPRLTESARGEVLSDLSAEHARLLGLLSVLRALTHAELAQPEQFVRTDLVEIAGAAVHAAGTRHPGAEFRLETDGPVPADCWPDGIRMTLDNLLDNAVLHGGAPVTVTVAATEGAVTLTVSDSGPGIPPADRLGVFERFHRRPDSPGSGLGLTLVAEVAELHRGTVTIGGEPGAGASFQVTMPDRGGPAPVDWLRIGP